MAEPAHLELEFSDSLHHPAMLAWSRFRQQRVEPGEVTQLKKTRKSGNKSMVYRLAGAGPQGTAVIAKRCLRDIALLEKTVYGEILPHLPVRTPRYHGFLEENQEYCWLFLEDVGCERCSKIVKEHSELAARWLGLLHVSASSIPATRTLPLCGASNYLEHLRSARRQVLRHLANPAVNADYRALLERIAFQCDFLESRWEFVERSCDVGIPSTLIHGDFKRGNIHIRRDVSGITLFPFDWETSGWGVPAADLYWIDLPSYHAVVGPFWPGVDLPALERIATTGKIFRWLAALDWESWKLDPRWAQPDGTLPIVRLYQERMAEAIKRIAWERRARRTNGNGSTLHLFAAQSEAMPSANGGKKTSDALDQLLEGTGQPGLAELRQALGEQLGGGPVRVVSTSKLPRHPIYRLRLSIHGSVRRLIVKRLKPEVAVREQRIVSRWLPAIGLAQAGPPLLCVAAERGGRFVWHIYDDLGDCSLAGEAPAGGETGVNADSKRALPVKRARIAAAVETIARIHAAFVDHPLLSECRLLGGDLGGYFFASSARDALRCLRDLEARKDELSPERRALLRRLDDRIEKLVEEQSQRTQALAEFGGPETLLHGDLWPQNVMVYPAAGGFATRLIDWDHVGVGPISYDLSTFVSRFPRPDRRWILTLCLEALERNGFQFRPGTDWNLLFHTAECARVANSIIWRLMPLREGPAEWAFDELRMLEQWFGMLETMAPGAGAEVG